MHNPLSVVAPSCNSEVIRERVIDGRAADGVVAYRSRAIFHHGRRRLLLSSGFRRRKSPNTLTTGQMTKQCTCARCRILCRAARRNFELERAEERRKHIPWDRNGNGASPCQLRPCTVRGAFERRHHTIGSTAMRTTSSSGCATACTWTTSYALRVSLMHVLPSTFTVH